MADRVARVADAWFAYVKANPFAWKMLFQDVTGDPDIRAYHAGMRDAALLDREYWSLAIRDPELRARYAERERKLRGALAGALEARARHLGTPDLPMRAEDVARIVMSISGGLTVDELIEPGSVSPELVRETFALIYAGLVARAQGPAAS